MQGMFRANGCCGYVKKPSYLLGDGYYDEVFDPLALPVKKTLKVHISSITPTSIVQLPIVFLFL